MSNAPLKGNIGEWSELYALGYLLVHGGAFAADQNQEAIPDVFHKVLQVHLGGNSNQLDLNYIIRNAEITILISGNEVARVDRSLIQVTIEAMLSELEDGKLRKTFQLISGGDLLRLLKRDRISAGSGETENDLELVLEDQVTEAPTPRVGFNIKSQLGGRATLLNASGATNFVFNIVPNSVHSQNRYPNFVHGKHSRNLQLLYEAGYHLEFDKIASETFQNNLMLLDLKCPEHLAQVLLHSYLKEEKSFEQVVKKVYPDNDMNSKQAVFKLKEFLGAVAMGLRPSIEWDGDTTKFSGLLVVKASGEVVFYYLYNRKNFEEHLFRNVGFERPSTSRHRYGEIYSENEQDKLKLNLQIRFIS